MDKNNKPPLFLAIEKGSLAVAEKIVNGGAEINQILYRDFSPLHYAIEYNNPAICSMLAQYEANVKLNRELTDTLVDYI